jgi:plasmid stabilization system protein ParE
MSEAASPLSIKFTWNARLELDEIWEWNERRYGREHASRYFQFLRSQIDVLSSDHQRGKVLPANPDLRYLVIRRKPRGYGHIAVYEIRERTIMILHVFHTSQDWQRRLAEDEPR